jgi:hypothetical protein
MKFIFQDNYDNWFTLQVDKDQVLYPQLVGVGPWSYWYEAFGEKEELYASIDFFKKKSSGDSVIK